MTPLKQAPRQCPVCSEALTLTRLACDECGTELSGHFPTCEYCSLSQEDRQTLTVFLASRGNMKEVERHLEVSYPTARIRFDAILSKLGLPAGRDVEPDENEPDGKLDVLDELASGTIDVEEALKRLG